MERREFLRMAAVGSMLGASPRLYAQSDATAWQHYELIYNVDVSHLTGEGQLWLPVVQQNDSCQRVTKIDWHGGGQPGLTYDRTYQAPIVTAQWRANDRARRLQVRMQFATRDNYGSPAGTEQQAEAQLYLQPTHSMPVDGIVRQTAQHITQGIAQPYERAHAIYEWVVENSYRDPNTEACGLGDIKSMLESGKLGGKCADINSLFVGLARASGIPARECYGVRVDQSKQFKSLGAYGDVSKAQHCRAEFFTSEQGWVPVDPADVRKVVLQEKQPLQNPQLRRLRQRLFGYWEMNWAGFNTARDFVLPGSQAQIEVPFLMYPYAHFGQHRQNGHHPQHFVYRLQSRRIA